MNNTNQSYITYLESSLKNGKREIIDLTGDNDVYKWVTDSSDDEANVPPASRIPTIRSNETNDADSENVYIGPSELGPNVGLGLFAKRNFRTGDYICSYSGDIIETNLEEDYESDYVLMYDREHSIDASDPSSCYGRYANDPIKENKVNCRFSKRRNAIALCLRATKNISKGSEIYVSYGDEYWRCDKFYKLTKSLQNIILKRNNEEYADYVANLKN